MAVENPVEELRKENGTWTIKVREASPIKLSSTGKTYLAVNTGGSKWINVPELGIDVGVQVLVMIKRIDFERLQQSR